ncbi:MAG: chemotaxis protein CheW [Pseudomonadota bacterium]|nr:chemotaxis protein CheW [Pseudomonadota bacterium]
MRPRLAEIALDPFSALIEIDRRSRELAGPTASGSDAPGVWTGLGFRVGGARMLADRDVVREVIRCPALTRLPGARLWLRGIANVRGSLVPVTDLACLLEGRLTVPNARGVRLIVIKHPDVSAGLLVDEVVGFRQFEQKQKVDRSDEILEPYRPFVAYGYRQGEDLWGVFSFYRLVEDDLFTNASDQREAVG